jgi:hypothetical protein
LVAPFGGWTALIRDFANPAEPDRPFANFMPELFVGIIAQRIDIYSFFEMWILV